MIRLILAVLGAILEILGWVRWSHPPQPLKDLTPVDAIAGIADALRTYPIIGLSPGDGHGDERGPAFVIALIRDSRMTAAITDVVMEGANAPPRRADRRECLPRPRVDAEGSAAASPGVQRSEVRAGASAADGDRRTSASEPQRLKQLCGV